jgi:hypothetical protein
MKKNKFIQVCFMLSLLPFCMQAQKLRLYGETYYQFDLSNPSNGFRPNFIYSHNRHNAVSLNLGLIHFSDELNRMRFAIGLMAGTYVQANLASEPDAVRMVNEAYVGFDLSKEGKGIWLDMGVFSSHIGFESAIGAECATLSRSIMADNSPYYESGIRLRKTFGSYWSGTIFLLNGWQRMYRINSGMAPAFGYQVQYKRNGWLFNSSTYLGNETAQIIRMRFFHNFWLKYETKNKMTFTLGFDDGWQQYGNQVFSSDAYVYWGGAIFVMTYTLHNKLTLAARGCYFKDKNQVLIGNSAETLDVSLGLDFAQTENSKIRLEGRWLKSSSERFRDFDGNPTTTNFCVSLAFTYSLERVLAPQKYGGKARPLDAAE